MQGLKRLPLSLKHTLTGQDLFPTPSHFSALSGSGPALPLPPPAPGPYPWEVMVFLNKTLGFPHKKCHEASSG